MWIRGLPRRISKMKLVIRQLALSGSLRCCLIMWVSIKQIWTSNLKVHLISLYLSTLDLQSKYLMWCQVILDCFISYFVKLKSKKILRNTRVVKLRIFKDIHMWIIHVIWKSYAVLLNWVIVIAEFPRREGSSPIQLIGGHQTLETSHVLLEECFFTFLLL